MAHSPSTVALGTAARPFTLPDLDGTVRSLDDYADAAVLVVMFLCNHCPYVRHVEAELGRVAATYGDRGVAFVGICSNDVTTHPADDVPGLREQAARAGWPFDYLVDEAQDVARAYDAACTPDLFVYDAQRRLVFRGALDESSPGNGRTNDGAMLRMALDAALAGKPVPEPHVPSMGCGIKWKVGPA